MNATYPQRKQALALTAVRATLIALLVRSEPAAYNQTPLHVALWEKDNAESVALLLERDARTDA